MSKIAFVLSSFVIFGMVHESRAYLNNPEELMAQFQLDNWVRATESKTNRVRVAILDNGFAGFKKNSRALPENTTLIEGVVSPQAPTAHGLAMAEIFWQATGQYQNIDLFLVNTNGFSNFKNAIDFVISEKIDIVLYSQVWSFGGNFDGTGLIDAQVSRATREKIIWINAAGNFGSRVYDKPLSQVLKEEPSFLLLDSKNPVSLTLSWNDFSEDENDPTDQDLDIEIVGLDGKVVASSELRQLGKLVPRGTKGASGYARERVQLQNIPNGEYKIKIKQVSNNFATSSRVRVLIEAREDAVLFLSATSDREIFPPADHPQVITIGEDSAISSRSMTGRPANKPTLALPTFVAASSHSDIPFRGSSVSAAIFSGMTALMKVIKPTLTSAQVQRLFLDRSPVAAFDREILIQPNTSIPKEWKSWWKPEMKLGKNYTNGQYVILVPYSPSELHLPVGIEVRRTAASTAPLLWSPVKISEVRKLY